MTRSFLVGALLLASSLLLAYGASVSAFQADYDDTEVVVGSQGDGAHEYALYRQTNKEGSFSKLASLEPSNNQRSYQYTNQNSYRSLSSDAFTYRFLVHSATGQQRFHTVLGQTPSAFQRSWGTIKSMFR